MKLEIIVLRDIGANVYGQPMFVPNIGGAIRDFGDQINNGEKGTLQQHPEHFELYHIGWYGDGDAKFELFKDPKQIALGSNYRK